MSQEQLVRVRHVEIARARRVRTLARLAAPLFATPLIGMLVATFFLGAERFALWPLIIALAFVHASVGAVFTLLLPPLVALLARTRMHGPSFIETRRDALALVDPSGRARWSLPSSRLGVAWRRDRACIEIVTADGDEASLSFDSEAAARTVVASLRRAGRDRRAYPLALESDTARLWRTSLAWFTPCAMGAVLLAAGPSMWPVVPVALALGWLGAHGTRELVFGADGVLVVGRFRRRYIAYRDVARVEGGSRAAPTSLALRLTDGRRVGLGRMNPRRAILARALLEEGLRMVARGEAAGASAAALEHDVRDPDAWLRSVHDATHASGYRSAALELERLVGIVRNPAAEASQRVAAALALRADPAGLERIRVAAEVSTEPAVREALEALADEAIDERRFARAIRRVSLARR